MIVCVSVGMDELHSLDPRRQELLEARFIGAVSGNTGGSTGSMSGGPKVMHTHALMLSLCAFGLDYISLYLYF